MCELIQERHKSPWLWPDIIYNMTSSGRKHQKALNILHAFTHKVTHTLFQPKYNFKLSDKTFKIMSILVWEFATQLDRMLTRPGQANLAG